MPNIETVFSEYEARRMFFIFGENDYYVVKCVGKVEDAANVRTITKKCRGVDAIKRTRGTGDGTLKVTAHIPMEMYHRMLAMGSDALKAGVYSYGQQNLHPEIVVTADIFDEDNNEKYKAWPRCVISTGPSASIENGADEVAEVELEIGYMPDSNDQGYYEAVVSELTDETVKANWLTAFTPEMAYATSSKGEEKPGSDEEEPSA